MPLRTKKIIDDKITEKVNYFYYLWNHIGYDKDYSTAGQVPDDFGKICQIFKDQVHRDTKLKVL